MFLPQETNNKQEEIIDNIVVFWKEDELSFKLTTNCETVSDISFVMIDLDTQEEYEVLSFFFLFFFLFPFFFYFFLF
jgi:hypothetical protein